VGARQTGLPSLRVADLARDIDLVERAREAARTLLTEDPALAAHARLRMRLERSYAEELSWRATG
jgi:ATP-dependent DNA helicase RecG